MIKQTTHNKLNVLQFIMSYYIFRQNNRMDNVRIFILIFIGDVIYNEEIAGRY